MGIRNRSYVLEALGITQLEISEYFYGNRKADVIPELGVTAGYLMSTYATDYFRENINRDVWLNCFINRIELQKKTNLIVVDDMRFPNESSYMDVTVRVIRPNSPSHDRSAKSEGQLDKHKFTYSIINDSTPENLKNKTDRVIEEILKD